jgi:hypothetical protein
MMMEKRIVRTGAVAAVLTVAVMMCLAVAFFVHLRGDLAGDQQKSQTGGGFRALEERIATMEARLGALEELEERINLLAGAGSLPGAAPETAASDGGAPPFDGKEPDAPETGPGDEETRAAQAVAAKLRDEGGEESLRNYIARVIDERREERLAEQRRQAEERQREHKAMYEGPYGQHNFKVNSMAKKLDFSERQKQYYYAILLDYNNRIQATREQEQQDQENRQLYQEQRKELRKEFAAVITRALDPQQAEAFGQLPEREQRPDGFGGLMWNFTFGDGNAIGLGGMSGSGEGQVLIQSAPIHVEVEGVGITEQPAGEEKK